ncbi:MAG: Glu-tRNA(Gln) amidotransferase subunit GatE [Candidatus Woesearchaeota archaeon]
MSSEYAKVGMKSGIEIHQQLEGTKLFSRSPTEIRRDKADYEIVRRLRATTGEAGKVDKAAEHEQKKAKSFKYQGYNEGTSLVELDEEPPQLLNQDALNAALQVARMLNCTIVDQVHIMRKIVVDGSNTSGFQRTMLIGMNGHVTVNEKRIGIESVCLEEESCQAIQRTATEDTYNLSRLGIPLLEIATAPDIKTPIEAQECAAFLGMVLRSTGACKRGIGSIRQDLNMSIKGGNRIEIKGFQDLRSIPKVLDNEIARQIEVLKSGQKIESHVRKAEPDGSTSFLRPMPGAARMYPETDVPTFIPDIKHITTPKLMTEEANELEEMGISKDIAAIITKKEIPIREILAKYPSVDPGFIAEVLVSFPKELKRRYDVQVEDMLSLAAEPLQKLDAGKITKEAVIEVIALKAQGKNVNWSSFEPLDSKAVDNIVKTIVDNNPGAPTGMLMGIAMKELRGKVDGKKVMDLLQKYSSKRK